MAKTPSYSKSDLSVAASQCRRTILNKIKKGTLTKVSKTYAFDCVSKQLHLKSARTLWKGEASEYLNNWFDKLENEIKQLKESEIINTNIEVNTNTDSNIDEINNLRKKLQETNALLHEYEEAIKVLRSENEELRLKYIGKYGKIDL